MRLRWHTLSKREAREVLERFRREWPPSAMPQTFEGLKVVELSRGAKLYGLDRVIAVEVGGRLLPSLKDDQTLTAFPSVTVDSGAVPHIVNGARVMRPGVVTMTPFKSGDIVVVREQRHNRVIAVGAALVDEGAAQAMGRGPLLDTLHYVGDSLWSAYVE